MASFHCCRKALIGVLAAMTTRASVFSIHIAEPQAGKNLL